MSLTANNIKININSVKELPDNRKRIPLPNSIINKIKGDINSMPKSKLKQKSTKDFYWGGIPDYIDLPTLTYDLPIIEVDSYTGFNQKNVFECNRPSRYLGQNWKTINKSCVCIDKKTKRLLWIFIIGKDEPAIKYALRDANEIVEGFDKYAKLKSETFYTQQFFKGATKIPYVEKEDRPKEVSRYTGKNWLDGIQRYLDGSKGHNVFAYYPIKKEGQEDFDWRYKEARLYTLLYQLEKRYSPQTAQYRYDLAKNSNFVGSIPNIPIEMNPSTSMGSSIDFCSSFHSDSSKQGTLETIIWKGTLGNKKSVFVNGISQHYFDLNEDCMIFQVGTDYHGTAPTGSHGGLGFVNLTKSLLVGNTTYTKNWYDKWKKYLKMN